MVGPDLDTIKMSLSQSRQHPQVTRFCRQFLQVEHLLDFPDDDLLRDDAIQEHLYERLFAGHAAAFPPPPRYRLRVLKELVAKIESCITDWDKHGISENLMSTLSGMLSQPLPSEMTAVQQKSYVTYPLSTMQQGGFEDAQITLLESRSLISASGTTGLRTWEASLHLGQYLCANPSLVMNKRVLELGAGTGYLGILCAKYLGSDHVIASDGSDDVINNLPDSLFLNGLQGSDKITPMELKWGHALLGTEDQAWNGGDEVNVVLGADITYDASVIPALVATLGELVGLYPGVVMLIAATERNRETFQSFLHVCERRGFTVSHEIFPVPSKSEQQGPFYNDQTPIHICQLGYTGSGR
ncbi:putative methyltransferase-domain-containing protein [Bombardia bombarda]|uniref:Methyltransferase-domain-containing protein n=1 Tax=Bombardia bombarda TaxID=252184 RepID=A0AA40C9D6_9PEZI|nr:putative methyltransferase-domain-containing protein [Bombardia bombarda]